MRVAGAAFVTGQRGGIKALRAWVGMGAGGGFLGIDGEMVDRQGVVIERFAAERHSVMNFDSSLLIERCAQAVAVDVAKALTDETGR